MMQRPCKSISSYTPWDASGLMPHESLHQGTTNVAWHDALFTPCNITEAIKRSIWGGSGQFNSGTMVYITMKLMSGSAAQQLSYGRNFHLSNNALKPPTMSMPQHGAGYLSHHPGPFYIGSILFHSLFLCSR